MLLLHTHSAQTCKQESVGVTATVGVGRKAAQGQGIWELFQVPSGKGSPEQLYSHAVRENLEFSVVAISVSKQQSLSLTFRLCSELCVTQVTCLHPVLLCYCMLQSPDM